MGYLFVVEYKKGCENKVGDALSWRVDDDLMEVGVGQVSSSASLCLISFPCPSWIEELKASYDSSLKAQHILMDLKSNAGCPKFFSLHNGLILYKGRVFLRQNCILKPKVLHLVHDSPLRGGGGARWLSKVLS